MDALTISARSIAKHQRDHCGNPELAGMIESLCERIESITAPLPAEIEEIQKRHDRDASYMWSAHSDFIRDVNIDRGALLTALRASEARAAEAYEDAASLVADAMEEAWNEICADTGCHPLDICRRGRNLSFSKSHWAEAVASLLRDPNGREQVRAAAAIRAKANGGK